MKLLLIAITFIINIFPHYGRDKVQKVGTDKSEICSGIKSDWITAIIFFNKKTHRVSLKPGSKVDIIRDYMGIRMHKIPTNLDIYVSEMKETDLSTRARKIRRTIKKLSDADLQNNIEDFEASIFTVKLHEEMEEI
ncbi:MAG: hypothetical protein H6492_01980 [Candidatus Paracaedibacteraceae bacterium]|nr:hypothetical protein [Candidatus Paracaedibacteraceae bacterium]